MMQMIQLKDYSEGYLARRNDLDIEGWIKDGLIYVVLTSWLAAAAEMIQQVKMLPTKPNDLSLILGIHMI